MQTGSRRLTSFFMPIARENPREAEIASHRLMIRSGMIRQEAQGSFSWLPLGKRVLEKVCNIIREEQNKAGAQEILMPTVQSADLWRKSGRYDVYGKEMLRIQDRHERDLLYGPTNEEMATDIFSSFIKSYKDLPLNLYQIQWKYRDEIRPRFGVMRSREFLMKDAYSFDIDSENARKSYNRMFVSYLRIFQRMGLKAVPMRADTGPIGGDLSHEFIILAETGESEVFCQKDFLFLSSPFDEEVDFSNDHRITAIVDEWTQPYAATKEMHNTRLWKNILKEEQLCARGIEVGHIFYFGEKYSRAMNAKIAGSDGKEHYVHMGSYGIGPSRLVGALIEANHDEKGIVFPENLAPFDYVLVNIKESDLNCREMCEKIFLFLQSCGKDVLYDDTTQSAGSKLATADLIGIPWQIIVSPRTLNEERVELKNRKTGLSEHISFDRLKTMCGIVE